MLNNKYHALLTFWIIYIILFYKYLDSFTNLYNKNKGFLLSNSREQQELTIAVTAQTEHVPYLSLSETAPTFSKCLEAQEFVGSKSFSISSASPETRYFSPTQVWEPLSTRGMSHRPIVKELTRQALKARELQRTLVWY